MDWLDLLAVQGTLKSHLQHHSSKASFLWHSAFFTVHLVKAMVFPVVSHVWMWELHYKESWAPKNWCFWTVVLEKTLESPLDSKEAQPVCLKGNQSWYSLEGLMMKLKLQYFGHLMRRTDLFEKTLILWKMEGGRKRGWQRMRCLDGITDQWTWVWAKSGRWWRTETPDRKSVV